MRIVDAYDIAVDFMDMTDDRHLWVRPVDVRGGVEVTIGRHLVAGDDGADPQVARIVALDADGNIELEVLPGSVESHSDLLPVLTTARSRGGSAGSTCRTTG
jgi:hypothetical protein